jgi:regulatory protein
LTEGTRTALQKALHYLGRRRYSVYELEQRLLKAQYTEDDERRQAIQKLLEWGYLDNKEFACAYCRTKKERFSRTRIMYDLSQKGVDRRHIENALAHEYDEEEELRCCRILMLKEWEILSHSSKWEILSHSSKWKILSHSSERERSSRDWNYLVEKFMGRFARRGYPFRCIQQIVDEESHIFFPSQI